MRIDPTFEAAYAVTTLAPDTGLTSFDFTFPASWNGYRAREGVAVRVTTDRGRSWTGLFDPRQQTRFEGLYSWPDPRKLCVVSGGSPYVVDIDEPTKFERLQPEFVSAVLPIAEARLVIFADLTDLFAYGSDRLVWRTEDQRSGAVELRSASALEVRGRRWDPATGRYVDFSLDAATGRDLSALK